MESFDDLIKSMINIYMNYYKWRKKKYKCNKRLKLLLDNIM